MGIDIGGSFQLTGVNGSNAFNIASSGTTLFNIDTTGRNTQPLQIGFTAGYTGTDPGWTAYPTATWTKYTYYNTATYNVGGGFSIANSRFTAPVAGVYLFHATSYNYKASMSVGNYVYFNFWLNGGPIGDYKMRYGFWPTGYSFDGDFADLIYLNAGDYVECYNYATTAGASHYPIYVLFAGCLVG